MTPYIKIKDNTEYCVSDDGLYLLSKHEPGRMDWSRECPIPAGKTILHFREKKSGTQIEMYMSDNRWYEINSHGFIRLTWEEREKDRLASKSRKEETDNSTTNKELNKSHLSEFNPFRKRSAKQKTSSFEEDANAIGQDFINKVVSNFNDPLESDDDTSWLDNNYDDDDEEEVDEIESIRDLDEDDVPDVSERLLGEDYDSLNHREKTVKILTLYKSHRISPAQAIDQLEWIIGRCSYDVNDFVADFTQQMPNVRISEWVQKFIDKFSTTINRQIHKDGLFPELKKEFEYEKNIDESIKPNGFLDFTTKNRNKRVETLKDKRSSLRSDINYDMRKLRSSLISIMDKLKELLQYEKTLDDLEKQTPTSDGILSGLKEKKAIYEKKKSTKEHIKNTKDWIQSSNKDVREAFKDLSDKSNIYNQINEELLELTSSNRYNEVYFLQGEGIEIAKILANNVKITDSQVLSDLFKPYMFIEP